MPIALNYYYYYTCTLQVGKCYVKTTNCVIVVTFVNPYKAGYGFCRLDVLIFVTFITEGWRAGIAPMETFLERCQ